MRTPGPVFRLAVISPGRGDVWIVLRGEHGRMVMQSQVKPLKMAAAALVAGVVAMLAACSSATSSSSGGTAAPRPTSSSAHSGSPMANQGTCQHVDSLRTSLENLTHLQLNASSAGKIRTDLTNIKTQLAAVKSEGSSAFSSQVSQLSAALKKVEKAATGLSANPSATQVQAIITALGGLKDTSKATVSELNAMCPNS